MLELAEAPPMPYAADLAEVCRRIPPLWELPNFVAVNPFVGLSERPLADAARLVRDGLGGQLLPGLGFYRERWLAGAFSEADLAEAARESGADPSALRAILDGAAPSPSRPPGEAATFAERHDRRYGGAWAELLDQQAALCCAVQLQKGAAPAQGLYAAWRADAQLDRSLEIAGLAGWRAWVRALPAEPGPAIGLMLDRLGPIVGGRTAYLYRLLGGVYGWASYLRRLSWGDADPAAGPLADLVAIRICADAAVARLAPRGPELAPAAGGGPAVEDEATRATLQAAYEGGYARRLLAALNVPPAAQAGARPDVQAIFCIDVRSEPLRRQLEAQSPTVETLGFAGFFGVSLEWGADGLDSARCPVLLSPALSLRPLDGPAPQAGRQLLKELQAAPPAAFSSVELTGLAYGLRMLAEALPLGRAVPSAEAGAAFALAPRGDGDGIAPAAQLDLAASILKNTGLRERFGRLVLLCGHESASANNAHAAGLDCGACGGHSGAINARVAAALLNDPLVRAGLPARGYRLPADTWFVPGVHNTTYDTVTLLDTAAAPAGHRADLERLRAWLDRACADLRAERAPALGLADRPAAALGRLLRRRAADWSEARPEWGLAGNAAFIAARRARTRGVNLGGRSFLHEYDWTTDPDGSILGLILSAPMVVASWISWQYFASTVDNRVFGSGTKALHNRVGSTGVLLGNGGDLRPGLSLQSLQSADGSWRHEPLRLQVIVEAPRERIAAALASLPAVRELVENGWVRLFALSPDDDGAAAWAPGQGWAEGG